MTQICKQKSLSDFDDASECSLPVDDSDTKLDETDRSRFPTDINEYTSTAVELPCLTWHGYYNQPKSLLLHNTGKSIRMTGVWGRGRPYIIGGPLNGAYLFSHVHFHLPSEHLINNQRYPLEMHAVHFKASYVTHERAMEAIDGTVSIVYLFEINTSIDQTRMSLITDSLGKLLVDECTEICSVPLEKFLKPFHNNYFIYWGSISQGDSKYGLQWLISCTKQTISIKELSRLQEFYGVDDDVRLRVKGRNHDAKEPTGELFLVGNTIVTKMDSCTSDSRVHDSQSEKSKSTSSLGKDRCRRRSSGSNKNLPDKPSKESKDMKDKSAKESKETRDKPSRECRDRMLKELCKDKTVKKLYSRTPSNTTHCKGSSSSLGDGSSKSGRSQRCQALVDMIDSISNNQKCFPSNSSKNLDKKAEGAEQKSSLREFLDRFMEEHAEETSCVQDGVLIKARSQSASSRGISLKGKTSSATGVNTCGSWSSKGARPSESSISDECRSSRSGTEIGSDSCTEDGRKGILKADCARARDSECPDQKELTFSDDTDKESAQKAKILKKCLKKCEKEKEKNHKEDEKTDKKYQKELEKREKEERKLSKEMEKRDQDEEKEKEKRERLAEMWDLKNMKEMDKRDKKDEQKCLKELEKREKLDEKIRQKREKFDEKMEKKYMKLEEKRDKKEEKDEKKCLKTMDKRMKKEAKDEKKCMKELEKREKKEEKAEAKHAKMEEEKEKREDKREEKLEKQCWKEQQKRDKEEAKDEKKCWKEKQKRDKQDSITKMKKDKYEEKKEKRCWKEQDKRDKIEAKKDKKCWKDEDKREKIEMKALDKKEKEEAKKEKQCWKEVQKREKIEDKKEKKCYKENAKREKKEQKDRMKRLKHKKCSDSPDCLTVRLVSSEPDPKSSRADPRTIELELKKCQDQDIRKCRDKVLKKCRQGDELRKCRTAEEARKCRDKLGAQKSQLEREVRKPENCCKKKRIEHVCVCKTHEIPTDLTKSPQIDIVLDKRKTKQEDKGVETSKGEFKKCSSSHSTEMKKCRQEDACRKCRRDVECYKCKRDLEPKESNECKSCKRLLECRRSRLELECRACKQILECKRSKNDLECKACKLLEEANKRKLLDGSRKCKHEQECRKCRNEPVCKKCMPEEEMKRTMANKRWHGDDEKHADECKNLGLELAGIKHKLEEGRRCRVDGEKGFELEEAFKQCRRLRSPLDLKKLIDSNHSLKERSRLDEASVEERSIRIHESEMEKESNHSGRSLVLKFSRECTPQPIDRKKCKKGESFTAEMQKSKRGDSMTDFEKAKGSSRSRSDSKSSRESSPRQSLKSEWKGLKICPKHAGREAKLDSEGRRSKRMISRVSDPRRKSDSSESESKKKRNITTVFLASEVLERSRESITTCSDSDGGQTDTLTTSNDSESDIGSRGSKRYRREERCKKGIRRYSTDDGSSASEERISRRSRFSTTSGKKKNKYAYEGEQTSVRFDVVSGAHSTSTYNSCLPSNTPEEYESNSETSGNSSLIAAANELLKDSSAGTDSTSYSDGKESRDIKIDNQSEGNGGEVTTNDSKTRNMAAAVRKTLKVPSGKRESKASLTTRDVGMETDVCRFATKDTQIGPSDNDDSAKASSSLLPKLKSTPKHEEKELMDLRENAPCNVGSCNDQNKDTFIMDLNMTKSVRDASTSNFENVEKLQMEKEGPSEIAFGSISQQIQEKSATETVIKNEPTLRVLPMLIVQDAGVTVDFCDESQASVGAIANSLVQTEESSELAKSAHEIPPPKFEDRGCSAMKLEIDSLEDHSNIMMTYSVNGSKRSFPGNSLNNEDNMSNKSQCISVNLQTESSRSKTIVFEIQQVLSNELYGNETQNRLSQEKECFTVNLEEVMTSPPSRSSIEECRSLEIKTLFPKPSPRDLKKDSLKKPSQDGNLESHSGPKIVEKEEFHSQEVETLFQKGLKKLGKDVADESCERSTSSLMKECMNAKRSSSHGSRKELNVKCVQAFHMQDQKKSNLTFGSELASKTSSKMQDPVTKSEEDARKTSTPEPEKIHVNFEAEATDQTCELVIDSERPEAEKLHRQEDLNESIKSRRSTETRRSADDDADSCKKKMVLVVNPSQESHGSMAQAKTDFPKTIKEKQLFEEYYVRVEQGSAVLQECTGKIDSCDVINDNTLKLKLLPKSSLAVDDINVQVEDCIIRYDSQELKDNLFIETHFVVQKGEQNQNTQPDGETSSCSEIKSSHTVEGRSTTSANAAIIVDKSYRESGSVSENGEVVDADRRSNNSSGSTGPAIYFITEKLEKDPVTGKKIFIGKFVKDNPAV